VLLCAWPGRAQENETGKKLFATRCASCHGADGGGGEFGPDIADVRGLGHRDMKVADIIKNGLADYGMPAFPLPQQDVDALAAFVSGLRAPAFEHPPAGNAEAGGSFFFGKGNCANCHLVKGRGGVLGPDLSNLGRDTRLARIQLALRDPNALGMAGYKLVSVRLRSGQTIRGLAKNESNYDLQLQDLDGKLHFVTREEIAEEIAEPKGLMPPLSATDSEQRDLLAFLSRLAKDNSISSLGAGTAALAGDPAFSAIAAPKPGDWPTYHGHLSGNRHSELIEINNANVAQLGAKWMFPIADSNHLEVTPVVVDGVMYVTTANQAYALDARSGRQIWHYSQPLTKGVIGDAGTAINRHRSCPYHRAQPSERRTSLGHRNGRLSQELRLYVGSAGGQRSGAFRHLRRRRGSARFRGRLQSFHRRTRMAILEYAGARRAIVRNLGRPGDGIATRMRGWMVDRNL
jgi:putative heme-binding domain-containing protein